MGNGAGHHKQISIHTLREEGDPFNSLLIAVFVSFLSTPSARRVTEVEG
nr:MAG TPA: hypothetical protein [Bacteriophage sp.]